MVSLLLIVLVRFSRYGGVGGLCLFYLLSVALFCGVPDGALFVLFGWVCGGALRMSRVGYCVDCGWLDCVSWLVILVCVVYVLFTVFRCLFVVMWLGLLFV